MSGFNTSIIEEFRANKGKVGGMFEGKDMLLLHTTGRKSGKEHVVPLQYFDVHGTKVIVGSAGGSDKDPAWYLNLLAQPEVSIEQGTGTRQVKAMPIQEPERSHLWEHVVKQDPGFGEYPKKTSRVIPLMALV
jgi:deazaflavin-dependent oxidoreductase (nitroreductase family)